MDSSYPKLTADFEPHDHVVLSHEQYARLQDANKQLLALLQIITTKRRWINMSIRDRMLAAYYGELSETNVEQWCNEVEETLDTAAALLASLSTDTP